MAYDHNKYIREYNKKNIQVVTLKLHKENDADILKMIDPENKQGSIKKLLRKGAEK